MQITACSNFSAVVSFRLQSHNASNTPQLPSGFPRSTEHKHLGCKSLLVTGIKPPIPWIVGAASSGTHVSTGQCALAITWCAVDQGRCVLPICSEARAPSTIMSASRSAATFRMRSGAAPNSSTVSGHTAERCRLESKSAAGKSCLRSNPGGSPRGCSLR